MEENPSIGQSKRVVTIKYRLVIRKRTSLYTSLARGADRAENLFTFNDLTRPL